MMITPFQHKSALHRVIKMAFLDHVRFDASHPMHLPSYKFTVGGYTFELDTHGNLTQINKLDTDITVMISTVIEACQAGDKEDCGLMRNAFLLLMRL